MLPAPMRATVALVAAAAVMADSNFTKVGNGRCMVGNAPLFSYITGAYNNLVLRTGCEKHCAERAECIAYWYYTGSLFSSCFLDGGSANDTNIMAADLGHGWTTYGTDNATFCRKDCVVGGTDEEGKSECYAKV